jgi:Bacterial TniB protein
VIAPEALSLDDKIDVRRRLQDLASWQEAWRVQEKYLNQQIAAIAGSTKETDLKKKGAGKETDLQKGAELVSLLNRLELQQVKIPLEISPQIIEAVGYGKLRRHLVKQFVQLSKEERLLWLNNFLFIMTSDLRRLNDKIARIRSYRSFGQKRNFLLGGISGMGKTTYLDWYTSNYIPQVELERNHVPVIKIDAPEGTSPKPVFQRILRACGRGYFERDTEEKLISKIVTCFQACGVEVLIIDEIQHIQYHNVRRRVLEISNLTHHVPIICASCEPHKWIEDDPEIAGRWNDYFRLERYTGMRLQQLLAYINLLLPFPQNSFLSDMSKKNGTSTMKSNTGGTVDFIQKVTKGKLGNIMLLVREASTTAIGDNLSCLDEALLQQKWNNIQEKPAKKEHFNLEQSENLAEKEGA